VRIFDTKDDLDPASLQSCVQALQESKILCYPTETYYALGIDPFNEAAQEKLYALKQRDIEKQLPLIAADTEMVSRFCRVDDLRFWSLARRFWPGPLTLVLPSLDHQTSYAVRISSHPVARQISRAFGAPIVSTSANLSGEPPVADPIQLSETLQKEIEILVDAGTCPGGAPSSIVSLLEDPPRVLRQGAIGSDEIFSAL
jgi:L-threonylcarbamoyladenylate synthase